MADLDQQFWERRARRTSRRHNFACWLDFFLPAVALFGIAGGLALLVVRRMNAPTEPVWIGLGGLLLIAAAAAVVRARSRFFGVSDSLVRLDHVHRMHNRLTAASAGVGSWPQTRDELGDGRSWNARAILLPLLVAGGSLTAATLIPIPENSRSAGHVEPPSSIVQVEQWAEEMRAAEITDPEAVERLKEQIAEMKRQPQDEWYSHSSLEAADTLRQETESSLRELAASLNKAAGVLAELEARAEMSPDQALAMNEALAEALRGLSAGKLPLRSDLLAQLKKIDPSQLKQLSPEQLKKLCEQLAQCSGQCSAMLGGKSGDLMLALLQTTGAGGPGGGGGPAELTRKESPTDLHTSTTESVSNDDMTRAAPGEVLGVGKGEHEIDPTKFGGPVSGGAVTGPGTGGEAVGRESYTPREREVLQRFFK